MKNRYKAILAIAAVLSPFAFSWLAPSPGERQLAAYVKSITELHQYMSSRNYETLYDESNTYRELVLTLVDSETHYHNWAKRSNGGLIPVSHDEQLTLLPQVVEMLYGYNDWSNKYVLDRDIETLSDCYEKPGWFKMAVVQDIFAYHGGDDPAEGLLDFPRIWRYWTEANRLELADRYDYPPPTSEGWVTVDDFKWVGNAASSYECEWYILYSGEGNAIESAIEKAKELSNRALIVDQRGHTHTTNVFESESYDDVRNEPIPPIWIATVTARNGEVISVRHR